VVVVMMMMMMVCPEAQENGSTIDMAGWRAQRPAAEVDLAGGSPAVGTRGRVQVAGQHHRKSAWVRDETLLGQIGR
jgi:hypothetical protein